MSPFNFNPSGAIAWVRENPGKALLYGAAGAGTSVALAPALVASPALAFLGFGADGIVKGTASSLRYYFVYTYLGSVGKSVTDCTNLEHYFLQLRLRLGSRAESEMSWRRAYSRLCRAPGWQDTEQLSSTVQFQPEAELLRLLRQALLL